MKLDKDGVLKEAVGANPNLFYHTEKTPEPIISDQAEVTPPHLKTTFVYDIPTRKGKIYNLILK
jgi:alpha-L-fucosidase 2